MGVPLEHPCIARIFHEIKPSNARLGIPGGPGLLFFFPFEQWLFGGVPHFSDPFLLQTHMVCWI